MSAEWDTYGRFFAMQGSTSIVMYVLAILSAPQNAVFLHNFRIADDPPSDLPMSGVMSAMAIFHQQLR